MYGHFLPRVYVYTVFGYQCNGELSLSETCIFTAPHGKEINYFNHIKWSTCTYISKSLSDWHNDRNIPKVSNPISVR